MDVAKDLAAGGLANLVASCILNPCDVVKVRLQAQSALPASPEAPLPLYTSPSQTVRRIVAEEGLFAAWGGLWTPGIAASALREVSYSSLRFGLYAPTKEFFSKAAESASSSSSSSGSSSSSSNSGGSAGAAAKDAGLAVKIASGATSGGLGSVLATPTDVVKIRFQKEAGRLDQASGTYATGLNKGKPPSYSSTPGAFAAIYR
jgi:solute carrier family 25 uncoupling protein 8/9